MNNSALRLFVRSIISEAKEKKADKEPKKSVKKEEKLPKSSGKLMDLKKELAALEDYRDEIQVAKFAEKTASTEVEFAYLAKFDKELDSIIERGVALENEIEAKIAEIKEKISSEKNKIKEMIGLSSAPAIVGEKKGEKNKPVRVTPDNEVKADKDVPGQGMSEAKKMTSAQKEKKEDIVKGMKKSGSFGKSKEEKGKMYATATKLATKK
jgi:hypothetical protein